MQLYELQNKMLYRKHEGVHFFPHILIRQIGAIIWGFQQKIQESHPLFLAYKIEIEADIIFWFTGVENEDESLGIMNVMTAG